MPEPEEGGDDSNTISSTYCPYTSLRFKLGRESKAAVSEDRIYLENKGSLYWFYYLQISIVISPIDIVSQIIEGTIKSDCIEHK